MKLPQELEDIIFLNLNFDTLVECREIQSAYVKKCTEYNSFGIAAEKGNLHCIRYLFSQGLKPSKYYSFNLMNEAADNGHLEIVIWLHENRTEGCTTWAMDYAAKNGHLEIVNFLKENIK